MSSIGLVVDATCDLPSDFVREHGVSVMPISVRAGQHTLVDTRDDARTLAHYARLAPTDADDIHSEPLDPAGVERFVREEIVPLHDHVFCLTITSARSKIYDNSTRASFSINAQGRALCAEHGRNGRFAMAVISSQNMFGGQAVMASEIARLIGQDASARDIDERIRALAAHTHCYMVPPSLHYMYRQASQRGDKSVSWGSFTFGTMLDVKPVLHCHRDQTGPVDKVRGFEHGVERMFGRVARQIREGLLVPTVCVSIGGDPATLDTIPSFVDMLHAARDCGVEVLRAVMSAASGTKVGPGCISVGFVADNHRYAT